MKNRQFTPGSHASLLRAQSRAKLSRIRAPRWWCSTALLCGLLSLCIGQHWPENLSDPIHEHAHALGEIAPMRVQQRE
jgi:hypothetical protein